jgi:hypothetical protein
MKNMNFFNIKSRISRCIGISLKIPLMAGVMPVPRDECASAILITEASKISRTKN